MVSETIPFGTVQKLGASSVHNDRDTKKYLGKRERWQDRKSAREWLKTVCPKIFEQGLERPKHDGEDSEPEEIP